MNYTLTLIFFFSVFSLTAQNKLSQAINNTCVLKLGRSTGSGVVLNDTNAVYLVTARHNFYQNVNNKYVRKATNCKMISYPKDVTSSSPDTINLDLARLEKNGSLKYDPINDVAVLKIGKLWKDNKKNKIRLSLGVNVRSEEAHQSLNGFNIQQTNLFKELMLGDDIFIIGYPVSIGLKDFPQYDFNRPLVRKGIIAGKSSKFKTYIIDGHVYGGNSGGAVVRQIKDSGMTKHKGRMAHFKVNKVELVGIVSQFVPYQEVWENRNYKIKNIEWDNSGYGVIVPMDYVFDLIRKFQ